uniref:Uncharacterized protein n=1 Tax=Gasterosteus aculeatus TaxID=69293 RepID=G3N8R4_GASAC
MLHPVPPSPRPSSCPLAGRRDPDRREEQSTEADGAEGEEEAATHHGRSEERTLHGQGRRGVRRREGPRLASGEPLPRPRTGSSMSETRRWREWRPGSTQSLRSPTNRWTLLLTQRLPGPTRSPRPRWRGWRARRWQADSSAQTPSQKQQEGEKRLNGLHSRISFPPTCWHFLFLSIQ